MPGLKHQRPAPLNRKANLMHFKTWRLALTGVAVLTTSLGSFAQTIDTQLRTKAEPFGLESALTATLTRHPAVAGKAAAVQAKDFTGEAARTQRYPTISAQAQQLTNQGSNAANRPDNPMTLRARQPLWAFGRIDSSIALADAETETEKADYLRVQRQLIENTATTYAKVHGLYKRQKVLTDNVVAHEGLRDQIGRREAGQLASGADVRLANTRLIQAGALKARTDGDLDVALAELLSLTQIPVSAEPPVAARYTELPTAGALETLAQAQSAEVRYKAQQITRAKASVEQTQTASMPTIYLQADKYFNQATYADDTQVGLVLEANLDGMGLATFNRSKAAGAQVTVAEEDLRSTRNDIGRTVQSLHASRRMQQTLVISLADSVKELTALLDSYKRQYVAGTKSWLDVLNLQRELSEQRLQQVQAENDWLTASLRLGALTGGFDEPLGINPDAALAAKE
jgi:adhesin transport system outer membrane protein